MDGENLSRLIKSFPGSFINENGEFIAEKKANQYFSIKACKNETDLKCRVLEWFSRGAYKTECYNCVKKNRELHMFMLNGINTFLGTKFSQDDIELIYTYLGNGCNHNKTIKFIESGYDMNVLKGEE